MVWQVHSLISITRKYPNLVAQLLVLTHHSMMANGLEQQPSYTLTQVARCGGKRVTVNTEHGIYRK